MHRIFAIVLLLGALCTTAYCQQLPSHTERAKDQSSSRLSPSEIFSKSAKSTVMVIALDIDGEPVSIASGFFFSQGGTFPVSDIDVASPAPSNERGSVPNLSASDVEIEKPSSLKAKAKSNSDIVVSVVVTNLHALKWASSVVVKPYGVEARLPVLSVLGYDLIHDLCLLEVSPQPYGRLQLATGQIKVGDPVYVIGNPKRLEGTFSSGIVAAVRGDSEIQIDAPISPGSSGGPVLNTAGQVVGVATSSIVGGQNLNFAVPSRFVARMPRSLTDVEVVGALANPDREYMHFIGPVRAYTETITRMHHPKEGHAEPGPVVTRSAETFDPSGRVIKREYYKDGVPNGQTLYEYGVEGLRTKLIHVDADGHREEHVDKDTTTTAAIMASAHTYGTTWDEEVLKHSFGWNEKLNVHKYDARGNEIELEKPGQSEHWIRTFDSENREAETKLFQKGKLDCSFRFAYETDAYGNWTKKEESIWTADYAESGYLVMNVYRRTISYFNEHE